ncbi:MAG: hypothetical protein K2N15_14520 [Lachnospiraceae bacterium]|nr:hypothetical protein [Lachnospiraceae bacterium]
MTLEYVLNQAGIPLLLFVICMVYGTRLLIVQDASGIKGKNKGPLKNEKEYAKAGGRLILFFGIGTLLMAILIFVNVYAAVAEIMICTIIMGVLWKRMSDKYGG